MEEPRGYRRGLRRKRKGRERTLGLSVDARQRLRLPFIAAATATGAMGFTALAPVLPNLAGELGVGPAGIGFFQAAVAVPGVLLTFIVGMLSDRFGRRAAFIGSVALYALGAGGMVVREFAPLVSLRLLQGVGYTGMLTMGPIIIGDCYRGPARRRALGANTAALTLSSALSPLVGGWIGADDPFRVFLLYGLALPVGFVAFFVLPGGSPVEPTGAGVLEVAKRSRTSLRERGQLRMVLVTMPAMMLMMLLFSGFAIVTMPLFLDSEFALSSARRGPIIALANLGSATAAVALGTLGATARGSTVLRASLACMSTGLLMAALSPSAWVLAPAEFLLGLSIGGAYTLLMDVVTGASDASTRGFVVATWSSSSRLGQVAGSILVPAAAGTIGFRPAFGAAALGCLAVVALWRLLLRLPVTPAPQRQPDTDPTAETSEINPLP